MTDALDELSYRVSQSARVLWYAAHYRAAARAQTKAGEPQLEAAHPLPSRARVGAALRAAFEADWRNIEAGHYALPHDLVPAPRRLIERSRRFLADVPAVARRRADRRATEVRAHVPSTRYPAYYLQNFHFQTDGYLSPESAALYDFQVEALFAGAADVMRRQGLLPLAAFLRGRDQRKLALLDVACGTGRFLSFVKDNYPRLPVTGCDLSADYLAEARLLLAPWRGVELFQANAEAIPLAEASQDIVTSVFLFHELPPKARAQVLREVRRVLKPGGIFVLVDSLQTGDVPDLDVLLDLFPQGFHEPFYRSYLGEDFIARADTAGLAHRSTSTLYLAKTMVFEKAR